ncbi:MAG: helix-turn-helix domain-containing protein, partial [Caldimonas sp.]
QGLHIAALAASIKVAPKKLELLEADRFDALLDATFARALALTVCRALKIDPAPVMRLLPPPGGHRLEQVGEGLNAPFRNRPGALVHRHWAVMPGPAIWVTGLILLAALAVYFLPASVTGLRGLRGAAAPANVVAGPVATSTTVEIVRRGETPGMPPERGASESPTPAVPVVAPLAAPVPVEVLPAPTAAVGMLELAASGASWVEVSDARGQPLMARLMKAGETVGLDGSPPLKVRIGNAAATRLTFRGRPLELAAYTRDNVARLELK